MSLHKPTVFTGIATALITPFHKGEIDYEALENIIELQIDAGVSALLVAGTTGESATLSTEEHHALVKFAKQTINGRVPLLAGCGSNATAHNLELVSAVCEGGADALLAVTPYYNKSNDRGILLHYRAVADAATRPLILYNVPARTGFSLRVEHCKELAAHPNVVAIKEASGNLDLLDAICSECGDYMDVYTGNDHQILSSVKLGAIGCISVCSNLYPRKMTELYRLCANGEHRQAASRLRALLPQMQALFWEVNPIPVKYVAAQMGLCKAEYRLPLASPTADCARRLQALFGTSSI